MIWLWLLGCQEYTLENQVRVEVFEQARANAVDLLVVVDNSCSMAEEQDSLSRNFDDLIQRFVEAEVEWQVGVTTTDIEEERYRGLLMGGDDEIILSGPGGELDRVVYDRNWPIQKGRALQLDPRWVGPADNDDPGHWCASDVPLGAESGTPGEANPPCGEVPGVPVVPGVDQGPRAPVPGDLYIAEFLSDSTGDDRSCEWVELRSVSGDTLALDGLVLSDLGNNRAVLEPRLLEPHGALVLGRDGDPDRCPIVVDQVLENFTLHDDVRVLRPGDPENAELFAEQVAQGTRGAGFEHGFEAAALVFEEPIYTEHNEAWLRDNASLAVLFVSDEDDLSPGSVPGYLRQLGALKGDRAFRQDQWFTVSAVVGTQPPVEAGAPSCETESGAASYGMRYLDAVAATGGLAESICSDDFAPLVSELGLTLSGLEVRFQLSGVPDLDRMTVTLYGDTDESSRIRELQLGADFEWVPEENALVFVEDQVPPSETYVVVEYVVLPDSVGAAP